MNSKNRFFVIAIVVLSISLGACSAAADMDEVIESTELGAPVDPNDGQSGEGGGEEDDPFGFTIE